MDNRDWLRESEDLGCWTNSSYLLSDMVGPVKNIVIDWHIKENIWMMQELFIRST